MPDEVSLAEVARRLERLESLLQDLGLRLVSAEVYSRDQREIERRFTELERDLAEERTDRKADVAELKATHVRTSDQQTSKWQQAVYSGIIPGLLVLLGILLQLKGGGK